jgi:membrane-associated phospholipid phosphatase
MFLLLLALAQQAPGPASVYRISVKTDVPLTIAAGIGLTLPYIFAGHLITPRCPCDPAEVNAFDRPAIGNTSAFAATLSDITVGAAVVVPPALDLLDIGTRRVFVEDAVVFAQTLAVNGALVTVAKFLVQRPLPRTYAGDPNLVDKPGGYRSFYSGHTSLTFAALSAASMTMGFRHGKKAWPWIVTGVVGTSVAVERVADGRHFPSDVIVGALMGTATGRVVPWLHARTRSRAGTITVAPAAQGGVALGFSVLLGQRPRP